MTTMPPTYSFTCIPLDLREPASGGNSFELRVITNIQFPPGQLLPSTVREALSQHPLLSPGAIGNIRALIWPYQQWVSNGHAMNAGAATRAALTFAEKKTATGTITASMMKQNLLDYLGASNAPVTAADLRHDASFDTLTENDFVDVTQTGDAVNDLTHSLHRASASVIQEANRESTSWSVASISSGADDTVLPLENLSFGLARWINAAAQATLLDSFAHGDQADRLRLQTLRGLSEFTADIGDGVRKIQRRITTNPRECATLNSIERLTRMHGGQLQEAAASDPNVAIHAALKNPLLAESCGLVTVWRVVTTTATLTPNVDYVIQLDTDSLMYDAAKISIEPATPTVFRRDRRTHPSAFVDIGRDTTNEVYAYLNTAKGDLRYRASSVNTETAVVKQVILQANSSINESAAERQPMGEFNREVDKRPPQLMADSRYGLPEHETPGVTFSAPVADLIVPNALRFDTPDARKAALPCLFLEDLWVGYRLDVKEASRANFTSIHRQEQAIAFAQSGKSVSGWTEDFIEREQPDDPSLGFSSSELVTFNGMSTAQAKDYLVVLGTQNTTFPRSDQPFTVSVTAYGKSERLAFGTTYRYRLRNVFLGGVSAPPDDEPQMAPLTKHYLQTFPFYRAKALRAGEIVAHEADGDLGGRTIYLTAMHPRTSITLLPTPIDLDTARFHGLIFKSKTEERLHKHRRFISDLGKAFHTIPPPQLDYFYDPDVYGVVIRAKVVNGNERDDPEELMYVDGSYCRLTKHVVLTPVTEYYGEAGKWETFRPISIIFRTTSGGESPSIKRRGLWRGCRCVEVSVSPATEIHLSLVPLFDAGLIRKCASAVASSFQLLRASENRTLRQQPIVPAIAEQVVKVIHAIERPRRAPLLVCDDPRIRPAAATASDDIPVARRELDSEYAEVVGRIELDAASTKEVRLESTWSDVGDDPRQARYTLQTSKSSSTPRGVVFREFEPLPATAEAFHSLFLQKTSRAQFSAFRLQPTSRFGFLDQFLLQCAEDKVFLGQGVGTGAAPVSPAIRGDRLNVKDQRRKLLSVQAIAVSRFGDKFTASGAALERSSEQVLLDAPGSVLMTTPNVSHVVPLRRTLTRGDNHAGGLIATFALRVYLHRPWFQSGLGERLAVGCSTGGDPPPAAVAEIPKHITQWGEDPIERAGLETTKRLPKASDFVAVDEHARLSEELYFGAADGASVPVLYRDSVLIPTEAKGTEKRFVSLASYGVSFDDQQRLWYADMYVQGDFFGWCGLALYRHQPHAHPERELSATAGWVYAAVLYGEPVAWVERAGRLFLTIGPVYDKNVAFEFDSLEFRDGVSRETNTNQRSLRPLKSYSVGEGIYFEGILPKKDFRWSLLKKRFQYPVASTSIRPVDQ
jgi:hypothetical protein